jgi:PAS domain S-box-containing protein
VNDNVTPPTLFLDNQGVISDCSDTCENAFGYPRHELRGNHISMLLPGLEGITLIRNGQVNQRLRFICHCSASFIARHRDGSCFSSEVFINHLNNGSPSLKVIVRKLDEVAK